MITVYRNVPFKMHHSSVYVVFQTEYEGQAKQYMEVLDDTDAVVVAGGDGTLSEVCVCVCDPPYNLI